MANSKERLEQQMAFVLEIDKLKNINRQSYIVSGERKETDAEHSWHLALMSMLLGEYANEAVDILKVMKMVLVHDLVEIDAGDTYAFDEKGNESKREREVAAAERIFNLLPTDQAAEMRCLWDEFEEGNSAEAKFANTLDKIQPAMLNAAASGKSWREHDVRLEQILKRNERTAEGSKALWEFTSELVDVHVQEGNIKK